ncbi:enoyl-CoA hydratase [Georgenia alba]|uniref:Enoyl-CoA hydratase n=1 Tax=Georgenia alba TaxID=2233858 RepID=A0ABW2Q3X7_9MICO
MNTVVDDAPRVTVEKAGAVWRVEISNPARRNALTWGMYQQLQDISRAANASDDVRVLVLRGAGGTFAAGTDIAQFTDFDGDAGVAYEHRVGEILGDLLSVRVPVVGVCEGPVVGAGLVIAACCDLLVATEDAQFGIPVARTLGNVIAPTSMQRLRDRLGPGRTMAMLLTARPLSAAEAQSAGFVHRVTSTDQIDALVEEVVEGLLASAPLTLAAVKDLERRLARRDAADPADDVVRRVYGSADFHEGVTAFVEKRRPQWRGE